MNCFVIMPYSPEFVDVYATIRSSVCESLSGHAVRCFRLDEDQPAGRITDRLIRELQTATICIADLSGGRPNVMWETGYAMALGKPTIIITQDDDALPFDIHDMLRIQYNRNQLTESLGKPLRRATIDTVNGIAIEPAERPARSIESYSLIGDLLNQIKDLKDMMSQAVKTWNPIATAVVAEPVGMAVLKAFEGSWKNQENGTTMYARMIGDELVVPYCYRGNSELTGVYYGWKKTGDYWFARFAWLSDAISGFAFLKQESIDLLAGAWWMDDDMPVVPAIPVIGSGVPSRLERVKDPTAPEWAERFFAVAKVREISSIIANHRPGEQI